MKRKGKTLTRASIRGSMRHGISHMTGGGVGNRKYEVVLLLTDMDGKPSIWQLGDCL